MPRFQDEQQVYAQLGGMFEDALADGAAGAKLRAVGGTVQWELRQPSAKITVRLGEGETPGVDCGATTAKAEVVLAMTADTAHAFWSGELPMHVALSKGLIRAKGPVATILRIVPVVGPARELYAARVAGGGAAPAAAVEEPEAVVDDAAEAPVAEPEAPAEPEAEAPAEEPETPAEPEAEARAEELEAPAEPEAEAPAGEPETPAEPEAEAPAGEPEAPAEPEAEAPAEEPQAPAETP